jgi:hypothetical protein
MGYSDSLQPLRVTAHLRTAVVSDRWLPLDAILLYQASRERFGVQVATMPGGEPEMQDVSMPLKIIHPGMAYWYYACSWAQPQPWWVAEGLDHWNKRFDQGFAYLVDFQGRRGKVIIEQGRYKAYHMPVFYRAADKLEWYCVGDKERIGALLSTVTHIGKKRSQGYGRVIKFSVEHISENWSVWKDGRLTRGIPQGDMLQLVQKYGKFEPFNIIHYGIRPSYYRSENQMMLAIPG